MRVGRWLGGLGRLKGGFDGAVGRGEVEIMKEILLLNKLQLRAETLLLYTTLMG